MICYLLLVPCLAAIWKGSAMSMGTVSSWSLPDSKIINPDELRRILEVAKKNSQRDYVFFTICANTGLRLCEVGHIQKSDVRGDRLTIVRRKKKNLKAERIDVVPALAEILTEWAGRVDCGYIFPGECSPCFIRRTKGEPEQVCIGGHISLRAIQRRWELAIAEAGLRVPGRGIHSLRHFAVTQFYAKYRDLRAAQLFAGHSSSQITERYASVLDMKEKIGAMEAMV